jgi:peptidoglycan/xylan/chitin deacetylase (PgdA/CDA1 family)
VINNLVNTILRFSANTIGCENLLKLSGKKLILPFYHSVSNYSLPHISPLYRHKSVSEFETDLDFLLKHFTPVSLQDVHGFSKGEKQFSKPSFHLTFDDGLREVYSEVFPILQKKGIPATVFVNPDFVGNKALFFRYKAALLINKLKNLRMDELPAFPYDFSVKTNAKWVNWILAARYHQTELLDQLAILLHVDFAKFLAETKPYLNLEELKSMSENGIEIGAHSMNHPLYQLVSVEEQIRQTTESINWVKQHFQPKIVAFSFPFTDDGVRNEFFNKLDVSSNKLDLIFGTAGLNLEKRANHLHRVAMETELGSGPTILNTALLKNISKKIIGKNHIIRN